MTEHGANLRTDEINRLSQGCEDVKIVSKSTMAQRACNTSRPSDDPSAITGRNAPHMIPVYPLPVINPPTESTERCWLCGGHQSFPLGADPKSTYIRRCPRCDYGSRAEQFRFEVGGSSRFAADSMLVRRASDGRTVWEYGANPECAYFVDWGLGLDELTLDFTAWLDAVAHYEARLDDPDGGQS